MPNFVGVIKESIWRDPEWRRLPRATQATYCQLLSQKDLDRAGIMPLRISYWVKGCDELTEAALRDDLKLLEERRFVFIDEDTDELFVRSYMRHNDIVRYPNILKNALRCARSVASAKLRHELASELRKLVRDSASRVADEIDSNCSATVPEQFENTSETVPEVLNSSKTVREPYRSGSGFVSRSSSVVSHLGEHDTPPPTTCTKHPHGTDAPCHACASARVARERYDAEQKLAKTEAANERRAAIAACDLCDDFGFIELEDNTVARCPHEAKLHMP